MCSCAASWPTARSGWGEGVPRSYVTGETPAGCLAQLAARRWPSSLRPIAIRWPDVVRLCERFAPAVDRDDPRGCYGNALRCAVELSILDAFGRLFGEPVSAVARHFEPARPILAQRDGGPVQRGDRCGQRRAVAQSAGAPAVWLSRTAK